MKISLRLVISIFAAVAMVITVAVVLSIAVSFSQAAAADLADKYTDVVGSLAVRKVMTPFQKATDIVHAHRRRTMFEEYLPFYQDIKGNTTVKEWYYHWRGTSYAQLQMTNYSVGVLCGFEDGSHVEASFITLQNEPENFYTLTTIQVAPGVASNNDLYYGRANLTEIPGRAIVRSSVYDPRLRPWYRGANNRNITWSPIFVTLEAVYAIALAGEQFNAGRKIGVLALGITLDTMSGNLAAAVPDSSVSMIIVDSANYMLATSYNVSTAKVDIISATWNGTYDPSRCAKAPPGSTQMILVCQLSVLAYPAIPSGLGPYVAGVPSGLKTREVQKFDGTNYVIGIETLNTNEADTGAVVPGMNWRLVTIVDLDAVQAKVTYGRNVSIISGCVILVVITLLAIALTNVLLGPLTELVRQVARSAAGEPVEVAPVDSIFSEFSLLATAQESAAKNVRNIADAPTGGNVTLIFTDIESSTLLWGTCPNCMADSLNTHHETIREVLREFHGYEVKTVGDSFMIAVKNPADAVRISVGIQERLLSRPFPRAMDQIYAAKGNDAALGIIDDNPKDIVTASAGQVWHGIRVRIGMHMGTPDCTFDEVAKGYDYYGSPVNIAARVESIGHGGQIVASKAVIDAIAQDSSLSHLNWTVLGVPYLKGVTEPVEVYQITPPSTRARVFAPIETSGAAKEADIAEKVSSKGSSHSSATGIYATHGLSSDELAVAKTFEALTKFLPIGLKREMLTKICKSWHLEQPSMAALAKRTAGLVAHHNDVRD